MKKSLWQRIRKLWQAELFSPKDFLRRAVIIALAFAVVEVCGLRDYTSLVTGTTGSAEVSRTASSVFGVTYILFYLAFILLLPTLLLAAVLSVGWRRLATRAQLRRATTDSLPGKAGKPAP
jgi:hypothetical protein